MSLLHLTLIPTAFIVAFSIQLNAYGKDLEENKVKHAVLYVSNILISTICGVTMGFISTLLDSKYIIWIISSIVGTFLGKSSINIVIKIGLQFLKSIKNIDLSQDEYRVIEKDNDNEIKKENGDIDKGA